MIYLSLFLVLLPRVHALWQHVAYTSHYVLADRDSSCQISICGDLKGLLLMRLYSQALKLISEISIGNSFMEVNWGHEYLCLKLGLP